MRSEVKDTVLTKQLYNRLLELRHLYDRALTAENVDNLDAALLTHAGNILKEVRFNPGSTINNLEVDHLRQYMDYLKVTNMEYFVVEIHHKIDTTKKKKVKHAGTASTFDSSGVVSINVPAGWDGRNSFTFFKLFVSKSVGGNLLTDFDTHQVPVEAHDLVVADMNVKMRVRKSPKKLEIDYTFGNPGSAHPIFYSKSYIGGYALLMRRK